MFEQKKKNTHMVEYVQYTTHVYQNTEYYILFTDHRDWYCTLFASDSGE